MKQRVKGKGIRAISHWYGLIVAGGGFAKDMQAAPPRKGTKFWQCPVGHRFPLVDADGSLIVPAQVPGEGREPKVVCAQCILDLPQMKEVE